jgi:hypothetical protein
MPGRRNSACCPCPGGFNFGSRGLISNQWDTCENKIVTYENTIQKI